MDVCLHVSVLSCVLVEALHWTDPQPRSPTKCLWIEKSIKEGQGLIKDCRSQLKKKYIKHVIGALFDVETSVLCSVHYYSCSLSSLSSFLYCFV
jgi:hypothetical protein